MSAEGRSYGPKILPIVATLSERASGFANLAECEAALLPGTGTAEAQRGSVFNRAHGNSSRCEMIKGEPMIVVTPRAGRQDSGEEVARSRG
jgi:hypothetical protein